MARNWELKVRCGDLREIERMAVAMGASHVEVLEQTDTFFHVQQGRLKLRVFGDGKGELIGYRRADTATVRSSDYTIVRTESPSELHRVLADALGIQNTVRKKRTLYRFRSTRIHLDSVERLGTFVELETVMGDQTEEDARAELRFVSQALGLSTLEPIAVAYADLLVDQPGMSRSMTTS